MIEAAMRCHRGLQRILARMAEGRMADIVRQAQRFGQIFVEPESARDAAADLRDLDAVGQADAVMIAIGRDEHLRLVAEATERDRMDDAVAVALEVVARTAHHPAKLFEAAPTAARGITGAIGNAHLTGSTAWPASLLKRKPSPPACL
jgi:hypothetical protein